MYFAWAPDPLATAYHVNKVTSKFDVPPPGSRRPDVPGGRGVPKCDTPAGVLDCTVPQAMEDTEPVVYYQGLAACGPDGIHEGP